MYLVNVIYDTVFKGLRTTPTTEPMAIKKEHREILMTLINICSSAFTEVMEQLIYIPASGYSMQFHSRENTTEPLTVFALRYFLSSMS